MGGDFERDTKPLGWSPRRAKEADRHFREVFRGKALDDSAQSTVEYAAVMAATLCIVAALGLLSSVVGDGLFVEHALCAASHNLSGAFGAVADVFSF